MVNNRSNRTGLIHVCPAGPGKLMEPQDIQQDTHTIGIQANDMEK